MTLPPKTILLNSIQIASPCTASWATMKGDDRVRHCSDCNKNVFNLSAMPEAEGAALLAGNTDGELCVRFYRRPDGTVMTSDCSTSARAYTRRTLRKLPGMAGAAVIAMSAAGAAAEEPIPVVTITGQKVHVAATMTMGAPVSMPVLAEREPGPAPVATIAPMMGKPSFDKDDDRAMSAQEAAGNRR
jgi:hypothetical protein